MRTVSFHLHKTALSSDGSWCCPHAQAHVYSRVFRALRGAGEHSAQERTTEQGQEQQQQLSSKTVRPYALPVPDKHDKTPPPSRAYMRRVIDMQVCILRNSISTLFGNVCAACRMRIVLRLLTLLQLMAAARFVASNKRTILLRRSLSCTDGSCDIEEEQSPPSSWSSLLSCRIAYSTDAS